VLNLGLESRRNRFGAAIVKAVLLLYSVVACVWMCPIEKAASLVWRLARPADMDPPCLQAVCASRPRSLDCFFYCADAGLRDFSHTHASRQLMEHNLVGTINLLEFVKRTRRSNPAKYEPRLFNRAAGQSARDYRKRGVTSAARLPSRCWFVE
jgi:hypothetical protein